MAKTAKVKALINIFPTERGKQRDKMGKKTVNLAKCIGIVIGSNLNTLTFVHSPSNLNPRKDHEFGQ